VATTGSLSGLGLLAAINQHSIEAGLEFCNSLADLRMTNSFPCLREEEGSARFGNDLKLPGNEKCQQNSKNRAGAGRQITRQMAEQESFKQDVQNLQIQAEQPAEEKSHKCTAHKNM
jgi:hypothetical protein